MPSTYIYKSATYYFNNVTSGFSKLKCLLNRKPEHLTRLFDNVYIYIRIKNAY